MSDRIEVIKIIIEATKRDVEITKDDISEIMNSSYDLIVSDIVGGLDFYELEERCSEEGLNFDILQIAHDLYEAEHSAKNKFNEIMSI